MNCHYVTRALTKPWESSNGKLWYYDFSEDRIASDDPETLFAQPDTNSIEIEAGLNKYIETPIISFRRKQSNATGRRKVSWSVHRAMHLYFLCQVGRYSKANLPKKPEIGAKLDEAIIGGKGLLDALVKAALPYQRVATLQMPVNRFLFFPSLGYFQFPVQDTSCLSGFTMAFAVPLYPNLALALIPTTADFKRLCAERFVLEAYSVGVNANASHILIPPEVLQHHNASYIRDAIVELRRMAIDTCSAFQRLRSSTVELYEASGFRVGPWNPE